MKNRNIFSLHLYIEGLKQLRKMGIFMLLLTAFLSLLTFYDKAAVIYTFFEINPMLVLTFILVSPVLTFTLFYGFNKRNSCDFYYAIPYSRTCIYISYVLSVITWVIGIFIVILIPSILSAIFFRHAIIIYSEMLVEFLGIIASSMLVISAITLAMSLTGKIYSNILMTGIILFMPRMMTNLLIAFTVHKYPYLDVEKFWGLLNNKYNIVSYSVGCIFAGNTNFIHTEGVIYTFVLAMIYFILAGICFRKRKSDIAKTTGNKPVSLVITGALPTLICVATSQFDNIILFYIIGIIVFFIFELTISRNLVKSLKKMPLFLIAILISLIFDATVDIIGNVTKATQLEADDIDYITLESEIKDNYLALWFGYDDTSYYDLVSYEIKIDDDYIKEVVAKSLVVLENTDYDIEQDYYSTPIAIHSGNKVYYRNLYYTPYADIINKRVKESEEFIDKVTTLPDYSDAYIELYPFAYFEETFSKSDTKQLYTSYLKEINLNKTEDKIDLIYNSPDHFTYDISIYFMYKGRLATIEYANIDLERTPNTFLLFQEITK